MTYKICFLSSEIMPFASTYPLAGFSRKITSLYLEEIDIRLIMPKYGFISERKYILREVIRLKDIPLQFNDEKQMGSLKSAFIPETRVQVYFMENEEYFKGLPELVYKARNGRPFKDNDERFCYFSFVALKTLTQLFWNPDFIFCNDWQTALVPKMLNEIYTSEFYVNIKPIFFLHSVNEMRMYTSGALKMAGMECPDNIVDGTKMAIEHSALTVLMDDDKNTIMADLEKEPDLLEAFNNSNNLSFSVAKYPKPDVWKNITKTIKEQLQKLS